MALKQVKEYYRKVENQYFRMTTDTKEFDELVKQGKIAPEQVEQAHIMLSKVEDNYKRLTYIMYLFNMPNRKQKAVKYIDKNQNIEKALVNYNSTSVIEENEDVLKKFKQYIEEVKK